MPDKEDDRMSKRGQLWIALIGLVGVLGGALFANYDKIFPPRKGVTPAAADSTSDDARPPAAAPEVSPPAVIAIAASEFVNGSGVAMASGQVAKYGNVLMNMAPYDDRPNAAEFQIYPTAPGHYQLSVEYAAGEPRPVVLLVNGEAVSSQALSAPTGCWEPECQSWRNQGEVSLRAGKNILRFERQGVFPHIRSIRLRFVQ